MAQHVKVVDYDPSWPMLYEKEKKLILSILKDNALAIYHPMFFM